MAKPARKLAWGTVAKGEKSNFIYMPTWKKCCSKTRSRKAGLNHYQVFYVQSAPILTQLEGPCSGHGMDIEIRCTVQLRSWQC